MENKQHRNLIESVNQVVQEGILSTVGTGIATGAKACANNPLCRKAALAAGSWAGKKILDKMKNQEVEESVELDESKMSEINAMSREGKTHEEIGKAMNIHPSVIKKVLSGRTPAVVKGKIQGSRINKDKLGTGHVYKVDTVQGKPVKTESTDHNKRNKLIERFKNIVLSEIESSDNDYVSKIADLERESQESKERRKKRREERKARRVKGKAEREARKETKSPVSYRDVENKDPHLALKKNMGKKRYKEWLELSTSPSHALTPGERDRLRIHNLKVKHVMPSANK